MGRLCNFAALLGGLVIVATAQAATITTPELTITFEEGTQNVRVPLLAEGGETFNVLVFVATIEDAPSVAAGGPFFGVDAIDVTGSTFENPLVDLAANGLEFDIAYDPSIPVDGQIIGATLTATTNTPGVTVDGLFGLDELLLTLVIDVSGMEAGETATLITGGYSEDAQVLIPNSFVGGTMTGATQPSFPTVQLVATPIPEPTMVGFGLAGLLIATRRPMRRRGWQC